MNNKFTGEPAGYGFINFESDQKAIYVMHRLGGKVIPNSNPPVRFKLNHNSTRLQPGETDTSIWVGDLTPEVDDFTLYQWFTNRYQTVRCAKVVLDETGYSKGYGFVRFGSEIEQQHALANMTGEMGLGSKPIKVSMANQKNRSVGNGRGGGPHMGWGVMARGNGSAAAASGGGGGGGGGGGWPGAPSPGGWPGGASAHHPPAGYSAYPYYQQHQQQQQQQHYAQQQQYAAAAWSAWQQQQHHQQQQQ